MERERGDEYYIGQSTWMYNPKTGEKNELFIGGSQPIHIGWSASDSNIYSLGIQGVERYDPATDDITAVPFMDAQISPDGKYCYLDGIEGDPTGLYRNEDNLLVDLFSDSSGTFDQEYFYADLLSWGIIDNETVAYIDEGEGVLQYIDCATGKMHKVIPPSPDIDPIDDLVGFRQGRPVWAKITGDKAELFYY